MSSLISIPQGTTTSLASASTNQFALGPGLAPCGRALLVGTRSLDIYRLNEHLPSMFSKSPPNPLNLTIRYNDTLYGLETVLSGRLTVPITQPLPDYILENIAESAETHFGGLVEDHKRNRQELPYQGVVKIAPFEQTELKTNILSALNLLGHVTHDGDTTLFYFMGHGLPGELEVGLDEILSYDELLNSCDRIKGRKALIISACYSGGIIDAIKERPTKDDYAAITSTKADELGVNWNDDIFNQRVIQLLSGARILSDFDSTAISNYSGHIQHPQTYFGFDDVI